MIRGLLLAAGASSRFGSPKLLHRLADGQSMGAITARNLIAGVGNALAVVRPGDVALQCELEAAGCQVVVNPRAEDGMGSSLAVSIAASADAEGWVIALADMPFIAQASIACVRASLAAGAAIVVPTHAGQPGHPVGFAARFAGELIALRGDQGARAVVLRHPAWVRQFELADANILRDIDTPQDL